MEERTAFRTCPFCEATCGLAVTVRDDAVVRVRGDADDVFSRGFLCPKGVAIADLHEDPDRLRTPLVRDAGGELRPAGWDEALATVGARLAAVRDAHGPDAVAVYIGNPAAHGLAALLYGRVLLKALGTRNVYSASTVDQRPKEISSGLMFGAPLSVPIPDVDRTQHLLMLGANPLASNGSLMTAPDMRGRLKALRARGGKLVVVDPRRSRTAEAADEHHPIRPGTDAHLLFALVGVLFAEDLAAPGRLADARRRDRHGPRPRPAVHARGRGAGLRDRGGDDPPHGARARGRRGGRGVRPDRHDDAGVRHARLVARRRPQRPDGQPRPAGRGDVPPGGGGPAQQRRRARARARRDPGPLALARPRPAREPGRAARRRARRGDGGAGRGPGARAAHARRQPGALDAELRAVRARAGRARPVRRGRHLRQRDDAPRRRGPPRAVAAAAVALRPGALPAGRAQRGELLAGRAPAGPGRARRVGDAAAPGRRWRRGSRRPTTWSRWTGSSPASWSGARPPRRTPRCTGATSRSCWPRWRRGAGRSGCWTCCCARVRTT